MKHMKCDNQKRIHYKSLRLEHMFIVDYSAVVVVLSYGTNVKVNNICFNPVCILLKTIKVVYYVPIMQAMLFLLCIQSGSVRLPN